MSPTPGAASLRLDTPGGVVEVVTSRGLAGLHALLGELWAQVVVPSGDTRPVRRQLAYITAEEQGTAATEEGPPVGRAARPDDGYLVSGDITLAVISELIGRRLLLHAGAVAHPRLGTVLLVGASGAGKSTATRTLARDGLYLTDELTVVHPDSLRIAPFPKPVSLVDHDSVERRKRDHPLGALGLEAPSPGFTGLPDHVLLLSRRRETDPARPDGARRVPLVDAVLAVIQQSSSIWDLPGGLGALTALISRCGGALEVVYSEAEQIAGLVESAASPVHESYDVIEGEPASIRGTAARPGQWAVRPFTSALVLESGAVVLRGTKALRLDGMAALVWMSLVDEGPMDVEQAEATVVAMIGGHPDSAGVIRDTLGALEDCGLARRPEG